MPMRTLILSAGLLGLVFAASPALAAPDQSGSSLIEEGNGFPPACTAPCYVIEKSFEVYLDGNNTGPTSCPVGETLYVYTLEHMGGTGPFVPALTSFEIEVADTASNVSSAGFVPGTGVAPSSTTIDTTNDVVTWDFFAPTLPNNGVSVQLFLCSPLLPGTVNDTMVSTDGQASLDAPGLCVGPVNPPVQCDLAIDKTCCIPSTPSPGTDICNGKVLRAVFEVVGGECSETTNSQRGKAKCNGPDPVSGDIGSVDVVMLKDASKIAVNGSLGGTSASVPFGGQIEFTNPVSSNGELKSRLKFNVSGPEGTQKIEIHTSCSKALRCDDQFGSLKLVELETTDGGVVSCAPPDPNATQCQPDQGQTGTQCTERPVEITFEYTGANCQFPLPQLSDKASCSGDPNGIQPVGMIYVGKDPGKFTLTPSSNISVGDTFDFTATGRDEMHSESKFLVEGPAGVVQEIKLHTSCSRPLRCGDEFGSLKITGFTQKDGTIVSCNTVPEPLFKQACTAPLAPPSPHCSSKLRELELAYIGDALGLGCTTTNSQNGDASCTGVADPGEPVSVTVTSDPTEVFASPDSGIMAPTGSEIDIVSFTREDGGVQTELRPNLEFTVTGPNGSQDIRIHVSCSQPLNLGDVFGSFAVVGMERKNEGFVRLGATVEYQYTVTNNSSEDALVSVVDDPHGTIATGETVGAGLSETFLATRTLFQTITNQATVTGTTVSGATCNAPEDELTVTVLPPPQGSFDCSDAKPIDQLSMAWNGTMDVCVIAFDGDLHDPVLGLQDNVGPNDVVTFSGMGGSPNNQEWLIYPAGKCGQGFPIGRSQFHISCSDDEMNGVEDCGKAQGNGKDDDPQLTNTWKLEGISGDASLVCSPDGTLPTMDEDCGLGFEIVFALPLIMAFRRRRRA